MYDLQPTRTDAESLARYARLLSDVFVGTDKFSERFLTWQYAENPAGTVVGFDALAPDGTLAAHYVTIPVEYQRNGQPVKGLLSLNTATHPDHQGKGLFTKLASATYEAAAAAGYGFVIGVANQNSTPGFLKKLGFSLIAPLDVQIGRGTVRYPSAAPGFSSVFSEALAAWRVACPAGQYFRDGDRLYSKTDRGFIQAILSQRPELARVATPGSSLVQMWIGHAPGARFGMLYGRLPEKLKPSPLNLIYRDLQGGTPPQADEIRFELIDFDAY